MQCTVVHLYLLDIEPAEKEVKFLKVAYMLIIIQCNHGGVCGFEDDD